MEDSENKEEAREEEPKAGRGGKKKDKKKRSLPERIKGRFRELKAEFKRVIWPDQNRIVKETTAVVVVTVILGAVIALLDFIIKLGLDKILQIG